MKSGKRSAFEHCYRTLADHIYTSVFYICKDQALAEELTQETFISAFEKIADYENDVSFIAWLKRIAFNKTMNAIRKEVNGKRAITELASEEQLVVSPEVAVGEQNILLKLLANVSENESLVLWLYIVEQYSHEEIADIVNRTPSYSKSIVSRCLHKIRNSPQGKHYAHQ